MLFPEKRELTPFPPLKNTKTIPRYKIEVIPEKEKKIRVVFEKKKISRPFPKTETPQRRICPRQVYSLGQKQLIERHVALDEPKQKDKYNYKTLKETASRTHSLAATAVVRTDNRLMYHSPRISGADGAEADEGKCADAEAGAGEPSGTGTGVAQQWLGPNVVLHRLEAEFSIQPLYFQSSIASIPCTRPRVPPEPN